MKRFTILFLLTHLICFPLFSQKSFVKYGKVSKEELAIETTSTDAEFGAVILSDFGEIEISNGLLSFYRHIRIKILNTNGLDEANVVIPYYTKGNTEKITNLKAQTLNVDAKGKVQKIPVNKKEIYTSDPDENWKEKRFTFSDVKPGSIIEYTYLKKSERFFSLETWYFQNELPTLRSELSVQIADNLDFRSVFNGNRLIKKYGNTNQNKWFLENLPPLKEEPYCPNPQDYVESIQFQLAGYKKYSEFGGGSDYVEVMTTWEKLAKELLEEADMREILGSKRKANKIVEKIISEEDSDLVKVKKIYKWVQDNLNWNREYRLFPDNYFDKILKSENSSSAEINLILVRLLQSAGFDANPLAISTKRHGLVTKIYPIYSQFNHLLAQVNIDGKDILMDAISDFRPYNLLSKTDLNPFGYLLSWKNSRWIDIPLTQKTRTIVATDLAIKNDKLIYKTSFSFFKHEAASHRWSMYSEEDMKDYIKKYLVNFGEETELQLDSFAVKNQEFLEKPLAVTCYFSQPLEDGMNSEIIYLSPFLMKHFKKNPFNNPIRYLLVDFGVPFKEKLICNLSIPKGYELAENPENIRLTTADENCGYTFLFQMNGRRAQISSELSLTKPWISPSEYSSLRELFAQLIAKQEVQLVLKKK